MKDISISDALRYLVIGVEPLIIIYFFGDRCSVLILLTKLGSIGLPLFAFAFGAIFYSIYKVLLHTWFIRRSHDWHKDSYRKYITKNYENADGSELNHWEAERFWYYLSSLKFEKRLKYLDNQSSMGHLVYQTGIMLILSPIILTISNGWVYTHLYFILAGFIILVLGWFYAGFMEKYIYRLVISLENATRKKGEFKLKNLGYYAREFGFKRRKKNN